MKRAVCLIFILAIAQAGAQTSANWKQNAKVEIGQLIRTFGSQMSDNQDVGALLSPHLADQAREAELNAAYKSYIEFTISGFNLDRDLSFTDQDHAAIRAWIHWKTPHLESESEATIQFEKVGDRWYFRDFKFLRFPTAMVVALCGLGLVYAVLVVSIILHWRSQPVKSRRRKWLWEALLTTPIGWALYLILKPWRITSREGTIPHSP
jgi:hypothetical protein